MMPNAPYVFVDLEQGTDAWHEWRRNGIGASEASTILGENQWKTPEEHLETRCGLRKRKPASKAMALGTELEPIARRAYEALVGERMSPVCIQSIRLPWMRASLDGMSWDGSRIVEIKCGERTYHETVMFQKVPRNYVAQLQHILAVSGLFAADFWAYWPDHPPIHLRVFRDDLYIRRLIEIERQFWERLNNRLTVTA